jgi:hypothetical protein
MRATTQATPRTGDAARAFFLPLEAFVVDDAPVREHPGRIARVALDPLWAWISRDLLPVEAKTYSNEIGAALVAGDKVLAESLTRAMHAKTAAAMEAVLEGVGSDDKVRRRLAGQIPIVNGVEAATEILALLKSHEALAAFGKQTTQVTSSLITEVASDFHLAHHAAPKRQVETADAIVSGAPAVAATVPDAPAPDSASLLTTVTAPIAFAPADESTEGAVPASSETQLFGTISAKRRFPFLGRRGTA